MKLEKSPKMVVRKINQIVGNDCRSLIGENLRRILIYYDSDPIKGPTRDDISKKAFKELPIGEEWRVSMINELIDMRDRSMEADCWSSNEIEETLTYLCTV